MNLKENASPTITSTYFKIYHRSVRTNIIVINTSKTIEIILDNMSSKKRIMWFFFRSIEIINGIKSARWCCSNTSWICLNKRFPIYSTHLPYFICGTEFYWTFWKPSWIARFLNSIKIKDGVVLATTSKIHEIYNLLRSTIIWLNLKCHSAKHGFRFASIRKKNLVIMSIDHIFHSYSFSLASGHAFSRISEPF